MSGFLESIIGSPFFRTMVPIPISETARDMQAASKSVSPEMQSHAASAGHGLMEGAIISRSYPGHGQMRHLRLLRAILAHRGVYPTPRLTYPAAMLPPASPKSSDSEVWLDYSIDPLSPSRRSYGSHVQFNLALMSEDIEVSEHDRTMVILCAGQKIAPHKCAEFIAHNRDIKRDLVAGALSL